MKTPQTHVLKLPTRTAVVAVLERPDCVFVHLTFNNNDRSQGFEEFHRFLTGIMAPYLAGPLPVVFMDPDNPEITVIKDGVYTTLTAYEVSLRFPEDDTHPEPTP